MNTKPDQQAQPKAVLSSAELGQACQHCGSECNERDELTKAEREIFKLRERELLTRRMLVEAALVFREYAALHRAKGPEHVKKAERNDDMAARIERVLHA